MNINQEDFSVLVFCAFRYCLGRMTYITSTMSELILKYWDKIEDRDRHIIKKEIQEAIANGTAGMEMDIEQWQRILEKE